VRERRERRGGGGAATERGVREAATGSARERGVRCGRCERGRGTRGRKPEGGESGCGARVAEGCPNPNFLIYIA
jgi:hypothetical protein